jgi:hypothetical protein
MKNIVEIDTKVKCWCCDTTGFFSKKLDEMTCPRCEMQTDMELEYQDFSFCKDCGIIFDEWGCSHFGETYNAHLIKEYEYEGEVYTGMPLFESVEEWKDKRDEIKVLKWYCPNTNCKCSSTQ